MEKCVTMEQTAGSFGGLRTGSSTAPLAMRLREAPLRMTISLSLSLSLNPLAQTIQSLKLKLYVDTP
jgi:hypothetical protein